MISEPPVAEIQKPYVYMYPTAFGPPPPGLFIDSQWLLSCLVELKTPRSEEMSLQGPPWTPQVGIQSSPSKQPEINQNSSPNQRKIFQKWLPEALLEGILGPCWPQKSVLEGYVGLKNRSWRASWGGLGAILGPLGPKSNLRPPGVRRWASKGLPGTPYLEAKLGQDGAKLGPSGP